MQVLEVEGEEAYFAAFQAQDAANCQSLDEDGFVDAIEALAPGEYRNMLLITLSSPSRSPARPIYRAQNLHSKRV